MKNLISILVISALVVGLNSCRKIIDIEQEEADQTTVIEANLFEGNNEFSVKLTKTGNFFGNNTLEEITNASVTLSDGSTDFTIAHTANGVYTLPSFMAISGTEYTLTVDENGNNFIAKATMPNLVPIDTITYQFLPQSTFTDEGYLTQLEFQDPAGEENFYRVFLSFGNQFFGDVESLILLDDGFLDGNRIEFPLFGAGVAELNDTVTIELHACDESTLTYLEGVDEVLGGGNGAPPANPDGNFSNGALGNFSVYAVSSKSTIIVP